jgi:hypothetical protein
MGMKNKLKNLLIETFDSNTFSMYHGGKRWLTKPTEILPSKLKRSWGGVGIYTTNSKETARKYAKGGRAIHLLQISSKAKDISSIKIPSSNAIEFIQNVRGLKRRKEFISAILYSQEVKESGMISLEVINNLATYFEILSGNVGLEFNKFMVKNGGQISVTSQSGKEYWILILDTSVIVNYSVLTSKEQDEHPWMLDIPNFKNN